MVKGETGRRKSIYLAVLFAPFFENYFIIKTAALIPLGSLFVHTEKQQMIEGSRKRRGRDEEEGR